MASIKILYNNCYGDFQFSTEFEEEYSKRTGHPINEHGRLFRIGPDSLRCDPTVISIFEEKGSEWSSGPGASLDIREIPAIFEHYWEIDDYDGNETIRIMISEAYTDILHTFMEDATNNLEVLRIQYIVVSEAYNKAMNINSPS
jgi:hypothetical protein